MLSYTAHVCHHIFSRARARKNLSTTQTKPSIGRTESRSTHADSCNRTSKRTTPMLAPFSFHGFPHVTCLPYPLHLSIFLSPPPSPGKVKISLCPGPRRVTRCQVMVRNMAAKSQLIAFLLYLVLLPAPSDASPLLFIKASSADTSIPKENCADSQKKCTWTLNPKSAQKLSNLTGEQHALAVFIFLTVANETIPRYTSETEPQRNVNFPREKWAWTKGKRGRFLATLPYDFDILSLRILTRDAYDLSVSINATPPECLANLSLNCIHQEVAKTLLTSVRKDVNPSDVCVSVVEKTSSEDNQYICFEKFSNGSIAYTTRIQSNEWITQAVYILWILSFVFGFFSPLLFKYLPKEFRKGPKVKTKGLRGRQGSELSLAESRPKSSRRLLIAKDDGIVDILRTKTESVLVSRFCRALFVVLLSLLPVLQAALYWYLKSKELKVSRRVLGVGDAFITLVQPDGKYTLIAVYCFCVLLLCIVFAIPKNLSDLARRLSGRKDERTFLGFRKPTELICSSEKRGFHLLYENMIFHLTCLLSFDFWKFVLHVLTYPWQKVCGISCFDDPDEPLLEEIPEHEPKKNSNAATVLNVVLLIFVFPFWVVTVLSAFLLYIIPLTYVAFRIWKMLFRAQIECTCCDVIPVCCKITAFPLLYIFFIVSCISVEASYFLLAVILTFNIMFLASICGFTILGLLFYIDTYIPYITLGFWILVFVIRGFQNFRAQYVKLKNKIFDECENYDGNLKMAEANIRESLSGGEPSSTTSPPPTRSKSVQFLVFLDELSVPSIPLELFLEVYSQVLPFKRIVLVKCLKFVAICGYLGVVFSFVMALKEFDAASPVIQALAILFLGGLPLIVPKKYPDTEEVEQKRIKVVINEVINEYCKRIS